MNPVVAVVLASIRDIHRALAWVAVLGNAVAGLWALGAHRSTALRGRALWWWTAAAQLAIVAQAFVGVGLVTAEDWTRLSSTSSTGRRRSSVWGSSTGIGTRWRLADTWSTAWLAFS